LTRFGGKDVLLDAQTLRTAGSAPYGGADIGECLAAARRVRATALTSWHGAWVSAAAATLALAQAELAAGRTETARLAFWRSSSYFRAASAEHRLAACVADCGSYDLFAAALERVPSLLAGGLTGGGGAACATTRSRTGPARSPARPSSATPKATTSAPRHRSSPRH
jgi:hypothetical protein